MTGKIRKATLKDAQSIQFLINEYAKQGVMLPRSLNSIYENIRDFFVYEENEKILGVCALAIVWSDLAEIRSLAVRKENLRQGIGKALVNACIKEAKELLIPKVFTLTYQVEFFKKLGFKEVNKDKLPQKIWRDCINCVKFPNCDETALLLEIGGENDS